MGGGNIERGIDRHLIVCRHDSRMVSSLSGARIKDGRGVQTTMVMVHVAILQRGQKEGLSSADRI